MVSCWCFVALSRNLLAGPALVFHVKQKQFSILILNFGVELLTIVLMDKMA